MRATEFACIGSRDADAGTIDNCEKLGYWISMCGGKVHTGNADGVDQAFARGANQHDPTSVYLHLPWDSYNRHTIVVGNHVCRPPDPRVVDPLCARLHPRWSTLSRGPKALHRRNVDIIVPSGQRVGLCLAAPNPRKAWGGGTAMGMKVAATVGVEVVNINGWSREMLDQLCIRIRKMISG